MREVAKEYCRREGCGLRVGAEGTRTVKLILLELLVSALPATPQAEARGA